MNECSNGGVTEWAFRTKIADRNGVFPLHAASRNGHLQVLEYLLAKGASVDKRDKGGKTALHWAASNGHLDVVKALLALDAKIDLESWDGKSKTPLYEASENGHVEVVKELLDHRANVNKKAWDGSTAIFGALWKGDLRIVELLLDQDASVNIYDQHGVTPLHVASTSKKGSVDIVRKLVAKIVDAWRFSPALRLILGATRCCKELKSRGASIDMANNDGNTPLHLASRRGHLKIVEYLLNSGANMTRNKDRRSPRDVGNQSAKEFFDKYGMKTNITLATLLIKEANLKIKGEKYTEVKSAIVATAASILGLSLNVHVQRQTVLTTSLMIECLIRHVMQYGCQEMPLLTHVQNIKYYWQERLLKVQTWKLTLGEGKKDEIKAIASRLVFFQNILVQAARNLQINLNLRVVGNVDDIKYEVGKMIDKMDHLDKNIAEIMNEPDVQHRENRLVELVVQIQRGFEHYQRQVSLGNLPRNEVFEKQVQVSQNEIAHTVDSVRQSNAMSTSFGTDMIETWMLASDDILFDQNNLASALGEGGFSTVFRGTYHGQIVAVKRFHDVIPNNCTNMEESVLKEIKSWKDVANEQYILTLIGVCTKISPPIIVSELCETNVRRYVRNNPEMLLPTIYQFARGLACLHDAGIIHRDLKGDNVLVTFQKTVAIADAKLSRTTDSLTRTTSQRRAEGTLNWMCPEQYFKHENLSFKSDVWSFGMTVWEIVCNDIPFGIATEHEFANDIFGSDVDRPEKREKFNSELERLWTLIDKCWKLDPTSRPTAREIVQYLELYYGPQLTLHNEDLDPIPFSQNTKLESEYGPTNCDNAELDQVDLTVTTLTELINIILADPMKEWPVFNNFIICPYTVESNSEIIFRVRHQRQVQKQFIAKLSENFESVFMGTRVACGQEPRELIEYVDWGEWNVANFKCFVMILECTVDNKPIDLLSPLYLTDFLSTQILFHPPPCIWQLDGLSEPIPRGNKVRKMLLRLRFLCEVRSTSSSCEYFPDNSVIQVEVQSPFVREALPMLKTSYLILKAVGLVSSNNVSFGLDYNFDVCDGTFIERVLSSMEKIHGPVTITTFPRLNEIVAQLESGDLEDEKVVCFVQEIKEIIEDYREHNKDIMWSMLYLMGMNVQDDVIGGLKKRSIEPSVPYRSHVRWICKKHNHELDNYKSALEKKVEWNNPSTTRSIRSITSAIELLNKAGKDEIDSASEIVKAAPAILSQSMKTKLQRQHALTLGLMVERVVRHIMRQGLPKSAPGLLSVINDIRNVFMIPLLSSQLWKLRLDDFQQKTRVEKIGAEMQRLQDCLIEETKQANIDLSVQVVGVISDLSEDIEELLNTIRCLDKKLESITQYAEVQRQKNALMELMIQFQRGLEFYKVQVALDNISHDTKFENRLSSCQNIIGRTANNRNNTKVLPNSFNLDNIATWIISSNDVQLNPDDSSTALTQGAFTRVFRGKYHGQDVAIHLFDHIKMVDSTDFENAISKEAQAWKNVSEKLHILSLVVSELWQTTIRDYVRNNPESLLPLIYQYACGLVTLHDADIIHGDLKSDNVLVTMEATVAIAGFGLTQKILNLQYRKAETTAYEAWNWMSPEQYFFSRRVTTKSDVWSFGMTLWEILCNDIPLRGYPEDGFRNEIFISKDKRPEKPDNLSPDLGPLWTLITKCWQLDPTARPSACEVVEFLKTHYSSQWKLHSEMPDALSGALNKLDHIYSIHSAIEFIRQILEPIEYNKSKAMQYARVILSLSLKFQTNRQSDLETGILVGRIVDHMMRDDVSTESSKLLEILEEIQRLWESTLQTTQTWKLNFNNDSHRFTIIHKVQDIIGLLQDRLRQAVKSLNAI
ncbi:hypothetical protein LEN26_006715 [Aphanomyces euteiches]|nr:hypothetical protein LEN26_006715 [Aphanomyces euteiches]